MEGLLWQSTMGRDNHRERLVNRRPDSTMQPQDGPPPQPDERDLLAGVYIEIEAEEKVYLSPEDEKPKPSREPGWTPPTTDELAGVFVYVEGEEKIYLPPNSSPPGPPPEGTPPDPSTPR